MILGLGSDLCDVRRLEAVISRFETRFLDRCFTPAERERADASGSRAAAYAKRFAAKEACAKALGTGLAQGVFWRDMAVINQPSGQPTMLLTGGAAHRLAALVPQGFAPVIHLTLTDEHPLAMAVVLIEARPDTAVPDARTP